jgi:hypothetical protein
VDFEFLFKPVEELDALLTGLMDGASVAVALVVAFVLGLRHASDPDHVVAMTSLVAADDGGPRAAVRLGAWWGVGHAGTLLVVGLPLIAFKSELPTWFETGAERAVGVVVVLLAGRVLVKWARGDYRMGPHRHENERHRHLREGASKEHRHHLVRSPRQALGIGVVHGLAGTGAVVLLLIASLPSQLSAAAALAVFAPMSVVSMAVCSGAFAWVFTRRPVEPLYRTVLIPVLGLFGLMFGTWYIGLA